ncbi:hypothetical protein B0H19DRAFT_1168127, partial [Mycena capillaripes]
TKSQDSCLRFKKVRFLEIALLGTSVEAVVLPVPIQVGARRPPWAKIDRRIGRHRRTGRPTHLPMGIRQTCAYGGV